MSSSGEDEYKRTLFDRHGPEAAHHLQTLSSLIIPIVGGALIGGALAMQKKFSLPLIILSTIGGSVVFAVWWWNSVLRLPRVAPKDDIFAANRLVDLYLAWPGHETKALRELRRLIDTYPESDAAERARAGLVNLKSQLGITE
jgi:hypothetical protein